MYEIAAISALYSVLCTRQQTVHRVHNNNKKYSS